MDLILSNIRSFHGAHRLPIRPITLLLGENSSGKTTFLASLSAVLKSNPFPTTPGLNDPPYDLGGFDQITSHYGGAAGRAANFSLGLSRPHDRGKGNREVIATYQNNFGQPELHKLEVSTERVRLSAILKSNEIECEIEIQKPKSAASVVNLRAPFQRRIEESPLSLERAIFSAIVNQSHQHGRAVLEAFEENVWLGFSRGSRTHDPVSIAPIRTKPLRTYDQLTDQYEPEGEHIPLLLAKLFDPQVSSRAKQDQFLTTLQNFGADSGLFRDLRIKRLGRSPSDPFQLLVKIATFAANISDVGYGVSQALPVVVQSILSRDSQILLIQQPEVHLHPRAQAAMGTLFVQLRNADRKWFVIETHSDYLVDRVRQHVATGDIDPKDVGILFFERTGRETEVFPVDVDANGNILNAPPTYRDFFIREQLSLFSASKHVSNS